MLSRKAILAIIAGVVIVLRPELAWPAVAVVAIYTAGNIMEHKYEKK
jgi:hypothetical protein